ncbi:Conserved_hypothetical protein [Hexamita inflata]|uniref:Uncharacterized protein n=1 Tax=Hexamita inflata TaxID=28002 RepID=A0AA86U5V5_9EUKA|nr:Conserved hypothetical protein [Hexamita inflata]
MNYEKSLYISSRFISYVHKQPIVCTYYKTLFVQCVVIVKYNEMKCRVRISCPFVHSFLSDYHDDQQLLSIYYGLMLSSIIILKQLQFKTQQCFNNILVDINQYSYCQKLSSLNKVNLNDEIYLTQKANNINLFIYANATQQAQIDVSVHNVEVNAFALFGFSVNSQIITDSNINISVQFQVMSGALLCGNCDVKVQKCNLVFIASGQQISGLVVEPILCFIVQQSFISFRITSMYSSGFTNVIKQPNITFKIDQCKLSGSNLVHSQNNGYIASNIHVSIQLQISELQICVDQTQRFGQNSVKLDITGESIQCNICENQSVVYGLCGEALKHSENVNGMYQCVYPFEYVNNQCSCATGYLLNNTRCINVVESIKNISDSIDSTGEQLQILGKNIQKQLDIVDNSVFNNVTDIEKRILSNYSKQDSNLHYNTSILDNRIRGNITSIQNAISTAQNVADQKLQINTSVLDQRIFNNVSVLNISVVAAKSDLQQLSTNVQKMNRSIAVELTDVHQNLSSVNNAIQTLENNVTTISANILVLDNGILGNTTTLQNNIKANSSALEQYIMQNATVLDWRIYYNVSQLNTSIHNNIVDINNSLSKQTQINVQQQSVIDDLIKQINCTNNYGYSMVNGSCVQVTCAIQGQQSINGICQCTSVNAVVQADSCVCPINSKVIGIICVCTINGQIMQNEQCTCSTSGAIVVNNACTCGVNGINISNTCSCPSDATLVNGVCTCTNINAYISGNQCVCPTYSSLVGNTCTCPTNSQIVNNKCICNLITGQIMDNSVCKCQTNGAFANNGACSCGQNALNVSNTCSCPTNSSLINGVCTCDKIIGQQIISGSCQCPSGQSVVNNSCKQTLYVINNSYFQCSQDVFITNFDIFTITSQITTSNNFSAGYVFGTAIVVQNAFIDISDSVYSTIVYPLFQSQNSFTNLKIQIGTQTLNSGSLLLSSSSISINQMNIISRFGSQLTVNSAKCLNILTSTSTSINIANLLVNLSYAPSNGNITLINDINGILNISKYEVLGSYVSTGTVSLMGVNLNSATVNVNQISIKPNTFNVGNSSSYLFGSATSKNIIQVNNFAVIIGNSFDFQLLGSISTMSQYQQYYQFGGIIAYTNGRSEINVNNIVIDSYQEFNTSFVSKSGFLVGENEHIKCSITIQNVCLQQNIQSTTLEFNIFGLIGYSQGNTSIQNVSTILSVQGTFIACFGMVGQQSSVGSVYIEVVNLRTSVSVSSNRGNYVGSLIGLENAKNCSVLNTSIIGGSINSGSAYYTGGFIGNQQLTTTIMNSSLQQTNIQCSSRLGGFVGYSKAPLYLINSQIQFVRLQASDGTVGIISSYFESSLQLTSSSSTQIYMNGVLKNDCLVLSNKNGC